MKRIMGVIILTFVLLIVLVYGMTGTGAWFTDQAVIENNVISTGNLDLVISNVSKSSPNLEPGGDYKEFLRFCAKNSGTFDMKWHGGFAGVQAPEGMTGKVLIKAIMNPAGMQSNFGAVNTVWFENMSVTDLMVANKHILLNSSTNTAPFKPNDVICYAFQAKLLDSAGNAFRSKTFTALLQLDATQWINSDWKE